MKQLSFIGFFSLFFILVFTPHVSAEVEKEDSPSLQNYQATMTPAYQEISGTGAKASWGFNWGNTPGPYSIYFGRDSGATAYWVADVGSNSTYNYSYTYDGGAPTLFYPFIRIANANYEPALGNATVYRRP